MSGATKGPWTVAKGGRSVNVGAHGKLRFEPGLPAEELVANCCLAAAAPDLLAAVRRMLSHPRKLSTPDRLMLERAVAKATGESS